MKAPEPGTVVYRVFGDEIDQYTFIKDQGSGVWLVREVRDARRKSSTPADWFFSSRRLAMLQVLDDKSSNVRYLKDQIEKLQQQLAEAEVAVADYARLIIDEESRNG